MLPSPTEIEYFVEVFRSRHLSKAAIRLGVTQPTLSISLKKLEKKLGAKLFHRTKQGVTPTHEGILFSKNAIRLLESWNHTQRQVLMSHSGPVGRFRVGCHPSVGAYVLPLLLSRIEKEAPGIELDLVHDISRKITEEVVSHALDVGFVVNPHRHPDLVLRKLGEDRVLFWKVRGTRAVPQILIVDLNLNQTQELLKKAQSKHFQDWKVLHTSSLELIRTLTLSGRGVGILPERVAMADGADLVPYSAHLPFFEDEIFIVYRKDSLESQGGRELVRLGNLKL